MDERRTGDRRSGMVRRTENNRRSGRDRRLTATLDIDYDMRTGVERRFENNRRLGIERRSDIERRLQMA